MSTLVQYICTFKISLIPTNNHALIRYRKIDECIRSERPYHLKDLIEACSEAISTYEGKEKKVSRRSVLYDLKFMKDDVQGFNAPIDHDSDDGYYYTRTGFSIFNIPIRKSDLEELREISLVLKKISSKEQFEGLEGVITRLEETYNITRSRNEKPVIQFEYSTNAQGQKWVNSIKDYIKEQVALNITYEPFDRPVYSRTISPYLLKEYNNRWFLVGLEHTNGFITNLGLDRVNGIVKSLQDYQESESFDSDTYLKDIVGVSISPGVEKQTITIKAYGRQRHYINTKPIHHSQECIEMNDDFGIFEINVIPNYELTSKLISSGENLEILAPKEYRIEVIDKISLMSQRYD